MRNALGFLIILFGLKLFFATAFNAFDSTTSQVLHTIETAASVSEQRLQQIP